MKRISDAKLEHLMDVAEREQELSIECSIPSQLSAAYAVRSLAASNLVLTEMKMREQVRL